MGALPRSLGLSGLTLIALVGCGDETHDVTEADAAGDRAAVGDSGAADSYADSGSEGATDGSPLDDGEAGDACPTEGQRCFPVACCQPFVCRGDGVCIAIPDAG